MCSYHTAVAVPEPQEIAQRELRNDSAAVLRAVERGKSFVITRNGTPVAELSPLRKQRFVPAEQVVAMFRDDLPLDRDRFVDDLDRWVAQDVPDA